MTYQHVLVAGGQGKLGSALGRLGANALGRGALDVLNIENIDAAFARYKPKLVINSTAYTNVDKAEADSDKAYALNRDGAKHLAEACARNAIPVVHISTDCVFGDGDPSQPVSETAPTTPLSVYGKSKLEGEGAVEAAGGSHCIARVSWLFDHSPQSFIGKMLALAQTRDALKIVDDAYGRPTEVNILAQQLLVLSERMVAGDAVPPILHLGPADPVSRFGWAEAIFSASAKLGGPCPALTPCSSDAFQEAARRPRGLILDTELADEFLGSGPDWKISNDRAVAAILSKEAGAT